MNYPNLNEEKKLWKRGFNFVAGLDEAGRGPLCGPVVAAAVVLLNPKFQIPNSKFQILKFGVRDSKRLSANQREKLFKILIKHPQIRWGIGRVSEKIIDKINILNATKSAMIKAVADLVAKSKIQNPKFKNMEYILIDGNFGLDINLSQKSIIRGDQKVFSIAAASIIAKVTRDRIMLRYDNKYPAYGFKKHKGYPTKLHRNILKKIGACAIHRKSFSPVSDFSRT